MVGIVIVFVIKQNFCTVRFWHTADKHVTLKVCWERTADVRSCSHYWWRHYL